MPKSIILVVKFLDLNLIDNLFKTSQVYYLCPTYLYRILMKILPQKLNYLSPKIIFDSKSKVAEDWYPTPSTFFNINFYPLADLRHCIKSLNLKFIKWNYY